MKWEEDPDPFLSTRFSEEIKLDNGYWLYRYNGVEFPDMPWAVWSNRYPNGQLILLAYTKRGARFKLWFFCRETDHIRKKLRRTRKREARRNLLRRKGE